MLSDSLRVCLQHKCSSIVIAHSMQVTQADSLLLYAIAAAFTIHRTTLSEVVHLRVETHKEIQQRCNFFI